MNAVELLRASAILFFGLFINMLNVNPSVPNDASESPYAYPPGVTAILSFVFSP